MSSIVICVADFVVGLDSGMCLGTRRSRRIGAYGLLFATALACGRRDFEAMVDAAAVDATTAPDAVVPMVDAEPPSFDAAVAPDASFDATLAISPPVLDDGLLLYLPLDGNPVTGTESQASDAVGVCINSACPTMAEGLYGGAYEFDGIDDLVRIPDTLDFLDAPEGTLSVWLYGQESAPSGTPVSRASAQQTSIAAWRLTSVTALDFVTVYTTRLRLQPSPLSQGQWFHCLVTWDNTRQDLYLAGFLVDTYVDAWDIDAGAFALGAALSASSDSYYQGRVDEVRLYDRVLTTEEIQLLATPPL